MFELGDRVKYSRDYIRDEVDNGMEKIYAAAWRGKIVEENGNDIYGVANADFEEDIEDIAGDILVLADD